MAQGLGMGGAGVAPQSVILAGNELPIGAEIGGYRVEGKLGEGGMGTVYAAVHPLIGKRAAIKVLRASMCADAEAVDRFMLEARTVNQVGHPNIVDIFDFGLLPDGRSYLVMECLQGETLASRLYRGGLSFEAALGILDQVVDALEAAHAHGITHRDLKPDNIYLVEVRGGREIVKLLDFGIAKLADSGDGAMRRTRTGVMMGTPGYMAPEQARGKNVDARVDIYALGCVAYEVFLGRLPFDADNPIELVMKHITETPPRPVDLNPSIPGELGQLLEGLLAKEPDQRPTLATVKATLTMLYAQALQSGTGAPLTIATLRARAQTPGGIPMATPVPRLSPMTAESDAGSLDLTVVGQAALGTSRRSKTIVAVAAVVLAVAGVAAFAAMGGGTGGGGATPATLVPSTAAGRGGRPVASPPTGTPVPPKQQGGAQVQPKSPDVDPSVAAKSAGTIVVEANVPARIVIDGQLVADAAVSARVPVAAQGPHEVVVTAAGRQDFQKSVEVAAGAVLEVKAVLEETRRPARGGRLRGGRASDGGGDTTKPTKPVKPTGPSGGQPGKGTDYTLDPFAR